MNGAVPEPSPQIASLERLFAAQRQAFAQAPNPSASERRAALGRVQQLLLDNQAVICAAISEDFGYRNAQETRLLEIFPSLAEVKHARAHVARWMKPERKPVSIWFQPGRARVIKQPLGVVGVIVPWNYPLSLAVGPLIAALAAGNRVMVKMSEFTPAFGRLFADLLRAQFAEDQVAVVNGERDIAQAFSNLPFDHLLFTGSTTVGRQIMRAAAEHLTPVTLELGGKSPAVVAPGFALDIAAQRIAIGKCLNAGQTCIAPDYALVPEDSVEPFLAAFRRAVAAHYPGGPASGDYTAVVNARHYSRLEGYLADARARGAQIESLGASDPATRKLAPTLVTRVNDEMKIMQEEIFGPLLPVVPYRTLEEALAFIAARPRPLAMYLFDDDRARTDDILARSMAGGVTVNDCLLQFAQTDLPFGGVGASGMGQYHGVDGFNTFTKRKGVFHQTRLNGLSLLLPPFGKTVERMLRLMLK